MPDLATGGFADAGTPYFTRRRGAKGPAFAEKHA